MVNQAYVSAIVQFADIPEGKRTNRQFYFRGPAIPVYNPFVIPQVWSSFSTNSLNIATAGQCLTAKGVIGKCTSFRQCYPYFKIAEFGNFESWVLGMYDTCSYYTAQGRQMFGVCCTNPNPSKPTDPTSAGSTTDTPLIEPEDTVIETLQTNTSAIPYYPQIFNWPPPLPTHSPNNTIPPLPTHPPSPGYPTKAPTAWPPTSHKPITSYPTLNPIFTPISYPTYKPPTYKPPTTKPTVKPPAAPALPTASCGAKNGYQDQKRIVGGHNTEVNEWPWIAALFNGGRQFCGGSLIDNSHILSAAHCVAHMSSWDVARLTVRLGDHNIKSNSETRHIEKRVKRVVRHRGFDARTLYNDIAILTLDSPVEFTQQIRSVCLPTSTIDPTGKTGTVIGWGSLRESGPQPAVLQEVNIPIWNNLNCKVKYGAAAPGGIVEHMLCAGEANRDSCSGDSGGPLMINDGKWLQVGIVSWGIGCGKGQYPGVYTRVDKFIPWIQKNLK
ncbi:proclotting enzyme [Diorhabda carinulata]|uniref:proclotting enzyme n=1 Tax=Diorhabda carinulata TaxID=1163345 RepID=UPI0025A1F101|nr:proclotting enzyme [Diorhabda carinulata]